MTTSPPPLDDLQLSDALDGDAGPDVAARLAGDPAARARLDQLRAARDLVAAGEVAPLPDATVDRLVAAALDPLDAPTAIDTDPVATGQGDAGHGDGQGEGEGDSEADGTVPIVAPGPSRRSGTVPPWLVAAVVLLLLGIGLTLVYTGRDDGTDVAFDTVGSSIADGSAATDAGRSTDEETAALESGDAPDVAGTAVDAPSTTGAPQAGTTSAPVLVPLGSFPDPDALRVHLRDGFPEATPDAAPATETDVDAAFRCLGKIDGMFNTGSEPVHVGLATVADEPTVVYELPYRTDDGRDTTLVVAVGELTCIPSLSFQR